MIKSIIEIDWRITKSIYESNLRFNNFYDIIITIITKLLYHR